MEKKYLSGLAEGNLFGGLSMQTQPNPSVGNHSFILHLFTRSAP